MTLWSRLTAARPFFLMAGPNVIESREHCLRMAEAIKVCGTSFVAQLPTHR